MTLTGRQIREGRALAGLSQAELAEAAEAALTLIICVEAEDGMPMILKRDALALRFALEAAGVEFITDGGVRLRDG